MRTFVFKVLAFVLLQAALVGAIVSPYRPNPTLFWAATTLKHDRLEALRGPRLILIGGSNVAFGVDSAQLERALGMPVVNMGLDAGVGLDFLLNEVVHGLSPGDVVVLSPEYELFLGLRSGQAASLARVIEQRPASVRYLAWVNVQVLLDYGFGFFHWIFINAGRELDRRVITGPYGLSTFNDYGDAVWHIDRLPRPQLAIAMERFKRSPFDATALDVVNHFHRHAQDCGATVYLTFPPLPDYYASDRRVAEVEQRFASRLSVPVLNRPADMFFPVKQFFDTEYHLLRHARDVRTARLISALAERHPQFANLK
jgi:hypothetical protein